MKLETFVGGKKLPNIFDLQFNLINRNEPVFFSGNLTIWSKPKFLKPLFYIFYKSGMMVSRTGENVPIDLKIIPGVDKKGIPTLEWKREFHFEKGIQEFSTLSSYDNKQNVLVDKLGPGKLLRFQLQLIYEEETKTLQVLNNKAGFKTFFGTIWLPKFLSKLTFGSGGVTQYIDSENPDKFHMELNLNHPVFGKFFGYNGSVELNTEH